MQGTQNVDDRTPLLGPTLGVPGATQIEVEDEDDESGESEEGDADITPVIRLHAKRENPLMKMLLAAWPFGESFKELGLFGKVYEIVKVGHSHWMCKIGHSHCATPTLL